MLWSAIFLDHVEHASLAPAYLSEPVSGAVVVELVA
jgi:hypothetical protein